MTEGTIRPPIITLPIIMSLIEYGFRVTGKIGGLPMGGRGSGFQAIGNIADKRKGLKLILQSLSFPNIVPLRFEGPKISPISSRVSKSCL